ncbi:MAG: epoxide hydrolase, partial [Gammaproteobacteria bacterium]|nr:epoxide hydrolase [Gammaproteobacteria bacterium]
MLFDDYRIHVSDDTLADLNARLALTRFPDYFSEGDWGMGIDMPYIRDLVAYWRSDFDWRAYED